MRIMMHMGWTWVVLCAACSTDGSTDGGHDGSSSLPDASVVDGATPDASREPDAGDPWHEVDALLRTALSENPQVPGFALAVFDAEDRPVFERSYGAFTLDQRVAIASASKLVAGTVLLELVAEGKLSLDATTGEVLGFSGENGAITLRHLLSFTSGLAPEARCTVDTALTLAACVDEIASADTLAVPGERFDYGSTHLHVAARMAEVVTDTPWNQLFRGLFADPLDLPAEVRFYTRPRQSRGDTNPLIAGGMRASVQEYAKLLATVFHRGVYRGLELGSAALFEEQTRQPFDVEIASSPMNAADLRYGLTAWLECATPDTGCARISSPGAFGFQPWLDRERGYYAVLGMELPYEDGEAGKFSGALATELKAALAPLFP